MSLHDDAIPLAVKSTYLDEVNKLVNGLECESNFDSKTVRTKVINKRSGKVKESKTIYEINEDNRANCIKRFWTRTPRSNSNSFVFHTVQNRTCETIEEKPIVLSRQLIKG